MSDNSYPAWVKAHESHISRRVFADGSVHITTPEYADFHIDRVSGDITVLVHDADAEAIAVNGKSEPAPIEPDVHHEGD